VLENEVAVLRRASAVNYPYDIRRLRARVSRSVFSCGRGLFGVRVGGSRAQVRRRQIRRRNRRHGSGAPRGDPVLAFGFTLACYGAISLVLVSALPGALALERTCLAFALLCVGGLLSEIATTASTKPPAHDADEEAPAQRAPLSPRLSLTLALILNLAFAVVSSGQGLIQIVPPRKEVAVNRAQEMEPIIVVARRTDDSADRRLEAL
jgi:hypothetical protein